MKQKSLSVFLLFILTLAAFTCSFVQAQESAANSPKTRLTFPILFTARHNYQGLHIYDTFYQWRRGVKNPGVGGIYILENPADPPEQYRIRPLINPTTNPTMNEQLLY